MADGADPSLGERVRSRSARWDGDNRATDGGEHVIERPRVLACSVADHEADGIVAPHEQVPGGLGGPGTGGVGGDPGEVNASGVDLDEEQHMETAQRDGIDAEEVGRDQGVGLAGDELAPRRSGAIGGGLTSGVAEDLPDSGSGDAVPETAHLSMDTSIAPVRVLGVEAQDEAAELGGRGWASGSGLGWLGPVPGDEAAVPADHRRRSHDQHHVVETSPVERLRKEGEHGPVARCELRAVDLALQDEDLVSKSENLCVTLVAGHQQQTETSDQ